MIRSVEDWFVLIELKNNDLSLAKELLANLLHYQHGKDFEKDDLNQLINVFTALRIDQLKKMG